jgi:type VI secretion system secreted protein Hcp
MFSSSTAATRRLVPRGLGGRDMPGVVIRPNALWKLVLALVVLALVAAATQLLPNQHAFRPLAASAAGTDPIYMKYGDIIKGDVVAKGHEQWIELFSFQWGVSRGISTSGAQADREASVPSVSEIKVTKALDSSSVGLLKEALGGSGQVVVIDFVKNDQSGTGFVYLEITLTNTLVSGFSTSSGGDRPTESLSLNFTKIQYNYKTQSADGTVQSSAVVYDLAQQRVI